MPLSEEAHEQIDAFLGYLEDLSASDDRYGTPARCTGLDESSLATRFEVEPSCWLEVGVQPKVPQIYVALVSQSTSASAGIAEAIRECEEPLSGVVEGAFAAAIFVSLDQPFSIRESIIFCMFATPIRKMIVPALGISISSVPFR